MMENFHWKFQPVGAPLPSLACDDQDYNHDDGDGDHDDEDGGGDAIGGAVRSPTFTTKCV